jgi:hypothetical protein
MGRACSMNEGRRGMHIGYIYFNGWSRHLIWYMPPLSYLSVLVWCLYVYRFKIRYKEHIQAIRNNNNKFGYSSPVLNTGHTYGTITDSMDVIRRGRKGRHLNASEKYIYRISRSNLHLSDMHNVAHNTIFQVKHELYDRWQHIRYQKVFKWWQPHEKQ